MIFRSIIFLFLAALWAQTAVECDGKIIDRVEIELLEIFEGSGFDLLKNARAVKISSNKEIIKTVIPAREGERCSTLLLQETERKLRSLGVFRSVEVTALPITDSKVIVHIKIQDSWTITPRLSLDSQSYGIKNWGIQDKNFLGLLKNVTLKRSEKDLYDETEISVLDRAFFGSDTNLAAVYADKTEGYRYGLKLDQRVLELTDTFGWWTEIEYSDTIFNKRKFVQPIYNREFFQFRGQVERQTPVGPDQWLVLGIGFEIEDKTIHIKDQEVIFDSSRAGPCLRVSYLKPAFKTVDYFNYFNYLEDIDVGSSATAEIFYAPDLISTSNSVDISTLLAKGFIFDEETFLFNSLSYQFRLEELSHLKNGVLDARSTFYKFFKDPVLDSPSSLVVMFNVLASRNLDIDREFSLGGENGLLGFKNGSLSDENIAFFKAELRSTLVENYQNLVSLGTALFFEAGSSAQQFLDLKNDILANVGIGLRLFFPDLSPARIFRIDFAVPLQDGPEVSAFEIRLTTSEEKPITRSVFEERSLFDQFQNLGLLD